MINATVDLMSSPFFSYSSGLNRTMKVTMVKGKESIMLRMMECPSIFCEILFLFCQLTILFFLLTKKQKSQKKWRGGSILVLMLFNSNVNVTLLISEKVARRKYQTKRNDRPFQRYLTQPNINFPINYAVSFLTLAIQSLVNVSHPEPC